MSNLSEDDKKKIELRRAIYLFFFFFLVIATFWTLKPLRTSGVVKSFSLDYYPLIKQGIIIVIPGILVVYSFLSCFFSRMRLVYFICGFFIISNVLFWVGFKSLETSWIKIIFFYYVDVYITIMVTIFWTYINDIYDAKTAKKNYGYIGAGGLLGGILGSSISGWASQVLGIQIILVATLFILPVLYLVTVIERELILQFGPSTSKFAVCELKTSQQSKIGVFTEGFTVVFRSKYLISVLLIVGLYEIISTVIDFQFNVFSAQSFATVEDLSAFQGRVFFTAQVLALVVQLIVTPFIHKKCGILIGLLFLPAALFSGMAIFMLGPALAAVTWLIGSEASLSYSINQASKEILYVPLDTTEKYKGKAFIDMFAMRFFKTLGAIFLLFYTLYLKKIGYSHNFLMGVSIILILIWFFCYFSCWAWV